MLHCNRNGFILLMKRDQTAQTETVHVLKTKTCLETNGVYRRVITQKQAVAR